jgi:hypothetical protein
MSKTFDMTDLGLVHYYLGVEVWKTSSSIFSLQTKYARSLFGRFKMINCKISSTPMEKALKLSSNTNSKAINESVYKKLVSSLIYLIATRPDLSFIVSFISRFMTAPKVEHWTVAKRVLRYVKGTIDFSIQYNKRKDPRLRRYTNSDWTGSIDDRKSAYGYVFNLDTGIVTWTIKKQHAIAPSSTEAKYRGECDANWLRRMLSYMQMQQTKPTPMLCDNQGVIKLAKNLVFHECTKHVDVHCHFHQTAYRGCIYRDAVLSHKGPNCRHSHQVFGS